MISLKFTLLGTGTSQGIPVIGCRCPACISKDKRDERFRCSALIEDQTHRIIIDVGPDFRQQALRHELSDLDAVLITHEHNDHVIGLDDLRPLIFRRRTPMKIYAEVRVLDDIRKRFEYAFQEQYYPGAPSFELLPISPGDRLEWGEITVEVIRTMHGGLPIVSFIIQDRLAYLTDVNHVPEYSVEKLRNIETLILDALRREKHHSHNNLQDAIDFGVSINAGQTFLIHLSHMMGPTADWEKDLPGDVFPSYDNQSFDLD